MSGFIAVVNTDGKPVDSSTIKKYTETLRFRGPDGLQSWCNGSVGLGHAKFITTHEAQHERQPASLHDQLWITGSFRIDAREDLIRKIGLKGKIDPQSFPDSYLILHTYFKWGDKCLEHILGDFAFVIWDKTKRRLFCARDPFGMKQL